jgi:hypothetical protein
MGPVKRFVLLVGVLFATLVPVRAGAATTIQPGDEVISSVGGCTLGFAADGGGSTYFLTAAHCVEKTGDQVELGDGTNLGTVAVIGNADDTETDWALIKVADARVSQVRGAVRGNESMPTGVAQSNETALGDLIQHSGYGVPWFVAAPLREMRVGVLTDQTPKIWVSVGPDTWGDSGGPVMHKSSGQALGLISRLCIGVCTSEGPTVEGILPQTANKGFPVTIRTV